MRGMSSSSAVGYYRIAAVSGQVMAGPLSSVLTVAIDDPMNDERKCKLSLVRWRPKMTFQTVFSLVGPRARLSYGEAPGRLPGP